MKLAQCKAQKLNKANDNLHECATVIALQKFYKNQKNNIIAHAALGWFFTTSFDTNFINKSLPSVLNKKGNKESSKKIVSINLARSIPEMDTNQTINYLSQHENVFDKYNKLQLLINSDNLNLTHDSFYKSADAEISTAQKETFNPYGFNVAIIGAGPTGLFLASILKSVLGTEANILVLDNRSKNKNTREIFSRNWLTHIPSSTLKRFTPSNVRELFSVFGRDGLIGIPINVLESILMLSCKNQGVNFYFSPDLDLQKLNNPSIDCFFDATAGQLGGGIYHSDEQPHVTLQYSKRNLIFNYAGIKQLHGLPGFDGDSTDIMLGYSGSFYHPFYDNSKIHTHMFKLTGIPVSKLKKILEFIKPLNDLNRFFVWKGTLNCEINEINPG